MLQYVNLIPEWYAVECAVGAAAASAWQTAAVDIAWPLDCSATGTAAIVEGLAAAAVACACSSAANVHRWEAAAAVTSGTTGAAFADSAVWSSVDFAGVVAAAAAFGRFVAAAAAFGRSGTSDIVAVVVGTAAAAKAAASKPKKWTISITMYVKEEKAIIKTPIKTTAQKVFLWKKFRKKIQKNFEEEKFQKIRKKIF